MFANAAVSFSNILRLGAAVFMLALFISVVWQNRARAQQEDTVSDSAAREMVGAGDYITGTLRTSVGSRDGMRA